MTSDNQKHSPINGTEHASYITERLNSPGFTLEDMETLRDDPTVLHHIKELYKIIMHNRACFIDKELSELGINDLVFPRGRIKMFEERDYTFSFTELSEYGENATSFKQLFASIGTFEGLSVEEAADKLSFQYSELNLESFIFPKAIIKIKAIKTEFDYDGNYGDPIEGYTFDIYEYENRFDFEQMKFGYQTEILITGNLDLLSKLTSQEASLLSTRKPYYCVCFNYSSINYDEKLYKDIMYTDEAVKALVSLHLFRALVPNKGVRDTGSYRELRVPKKSKLEVFIEAKVPGSLLNLKLTSRSSRESFKSYFDEETSLDILPFALLDLEYKFFEVKFNIEYHKNAVNSCSVVLFVNPVIGHIKANELYPHIIYPSQFPWEGEIIYFRN